MVRADLEAQLADVVRREIELSGGALPLASAPRAEGPREDLAPLRIDRGDPDVRVLRQTLGYCWSVVVAADPPRGLPAFRRLEAMGDSDMRWIARENRKKKRMPVAASAVAAMVATSM